MAQVTITSSDLEGVKEKTKLLKFAGQLDETNIEAEAQKVYQIMDSDKPKHFVFDFSELTYLNSKSIGYIADWQQKISGNGGKMVIFGAQQNIFDILDVVGLSNIVTIAKTLEEAKSAIAS